MDGACRFGSWAYDGFMMDLVVQTGSTDVTTSYSFTCPSVVQNVETRRQVFYYEYIPEPYVSIYVKLKLAWR